MRKARRVCEPKLGFLLSKASSLMKHGLQTEAVSSTGSPQGRKARQASMLLRGKRSAWVLPVSLAAVLLAPAARAQQAATDGEFSVQRFNPAPGPVVPQARSGCSKPLIIGCVSIFLVGAILLIGGLWYIGTHAAALLQWSFNQMETGLMAQLPKDVTPQEKADLQQAEADLRRGRELLPQRAMSQEAVDARERAVKTDTAAVAQALDHGERRRSRRFVDQNEAGRAQSSRRHVRSATPRRTRAG